MKKRKLRTTKIHLSPEGFLVFAQAITSPPEMNLALRKALDLKS